jgi:hypothetical protein
MSLILFLLSCLARSAPHLQLCSSVNPHLTACWHILLHSGALSAATQSSIQAKVIKPHNLASNNKSMSHSTLHPSKSHQATQPRIEEQVNEPLNLASKQKSSSHTTLHRITSQ